MPSLLAQLLRVQLVALTAPAADDDRTSPHHAQVQQVEVKAVAGVDRL